MSQHSRLEALTLKGLDIEVSKEESQNENIDSKTTMKCNNANFPVSDQYQVLDIIGYLSNINKSIVFTEMIWYGKRCYDLRHWKHNMESPLKGLTFSKSELFDIRRYGRIEDISSNGIEEIGRYQIKYQKAVIYKVLMTYSRFSIKGKLFLKGIYLVDWGQGLKIDIRGWAEDYSACTKGITLSIEEYNEFVNLIPVKR